MSEKKPPRYKPYDQPAGGWGAAAATAKVLLEQSVVAKGSRALLAMNQPGGFKCPSCAFPDADHTRKLEFCENGVKALAFEATQARVTREFFARHTVSELMEQSDYWLEMQGRLTEPMRYDAATDHYVPCDWDSAFALIARHLRSLESPHQAEFYTSGRTPNEAAFLYAIFVRQFGTNNFPDCSNMCHEPTSRGLPPAIGVGKGTVVLDDFEHADAIFVMGQNTGTNSPRMMTHLVEARKRGIPIVAVNPMPERALIRFTEPQDVVQMATFGSTEIASEFVHIRIGGDLALLKGMMKVVFEREAAGESVLDHAFLREHTEGLEAVRADALAQAWDEIVRVSGVSEAQIRRCAEIYIRAKATIICYGMGLTQHQQGSRLVQQVANLLFLRGNFGRPGAGISPIRGHSNVQGDRTVGINEKPSAAFLDALEKHFGFAVPRKHGHNVLSAIGAMLDGSAQAFIGLGGNFARATPDSALVEKALGSLKLTVHIATKPNHSHLMPGEVSFILPCLGRTEMDLNGAGNSQLISVEDSMSMVHGSAGINRPASPHLLSEVAIVAGIAEATVGKAVVDWAALAQDYDRIRDHIEATIPGFEDYNKRLRTPRGFHLRNTAAHREWATPAGKASFFSDPLPEETVHQKARRGEGRFALQTFRSHDQYNTTVYGLDDRYRGVYGERQVIFIHPEDLKAMGAEAGERVDVLGDHDDGIERVAPGFRFVPYDIPRGSIAGYYPELNVLVPLGSAGAESDTPTSKSIMVSFRRRKAA